MGEESLIAKLNLIAAQMRHEGDLDGKSVETYSSSERLPWLFSRRADSWPASGGASLGLLASH